MIKLGLVPDERDERGLPLFEVRAVFTVYGDQAVYSLIDWLYDHDLPLMADDLWDQLSYLRGQ